jgi:formate hydrogenlyase subunit 6/NADH:ubiquinone oxidoreductase subunit I
LVAIDEQDVGTSPDVKGWGLGLVKGLGVTLKHALRRSVTQQYPEVKPDLPPRTRGVIALKQANCTVCYKCSRECPDWCIYIDAHKETHPPASGGKARSAKVLDRFAIDFALCMYCGICVEVCPFDALFWSPEFEYAEYEIDLLTHEKEKLEEWTYTVLPPPALEVGAVIEVQEVGGSGAGAAAPGSGSAATAPPAAAPTPAAASQSPSAAAPAPAASSAPPAVAPAPAPAPAPPPAGQGTASSQTETPAAGVAPAVAGHVEVEPDQETYERVLAEQLGAGKDRRVAEGTAKRAAMIAARKKAGGA